MALDMEEIKYYNEMVKLGIPPDELNKMTDSLGKIMAGLEVLKKLSGRDIKPLVNISDKTNIFRDDEEKPSLKREEILSNAPLSEDGCFIVPKLVE